MTKWLAVASLALLATGCSRKDPCTMGNYSPTNAFWTAHADLVPPGAKVCGVNPLDQQLTMSFAKDVNPLAVLKTQLESKGYEVGKIDDRSADGAALFFVDFTSGPQKVSSVVYGQTSDQLARVSMGLMSVPCAGFRGAGTVCSSDGAQVLHCDASRMLTSEVTACTNGQKCQDDARQGTAACATPGAASAPVVPDPVVDLACGPHPNETVCSTDGASIVQCGDHMLVTNATPCAAGQTCTMGKSGAPACSGKGGSRSSGRTAAPAPAPTMDPLHQHI